MEDDFLSHYLPGDEMRILNRAGDAVQRSLLLRAQELEISPIAARRITDHRRHLGSKLHERLGQVAADKTASARD